MCSPGKFHAKLTWHLVAARPSAAQNDTHPVKKEKMKLNTTAHCARCCGMLTEQRHICYEVLPGHPSSRLYDVLLGLMSDLTGVLSRWHADVLLPQETAMPMRGGQRSCGDAGDTVGIDCRVLHLLARRKTNQRAQPLRSSCRGAAGSRQTQPYLLAGRGGACCIFTSSRLDSSKD
jgi:hypothetical protein